MVRSLENPGAYTSNEHYQDQIIGEPRGVYIELTLSWSDHWRTQGRIHRINTIIIRSLENPGAYTSNKHYHGQIFGEPRGVYIE